MFMNQLLDYPFVALILGLKIYEFMIFIYILSSWVGGLPRNKFGFFIVDLMRPVMRIVRIVPHKIGIIDISPLYAIFLVEMIRNLVFLLYQNISMIK